MALRAARCRKVSKGRTYAGLTLAPLPVAQAFKVLISSSSLSAMARTSAWVGGLEIVRSSGVKEVRRPRMSSNIPEMAWIWPRISPERIGALSAGLVHSAFFILPSAFTWRARPAPPQGQANWGLHPRGMVIQTNWFFSIKPKASVVLLV